MTPTNTQPDAMVLKLAQRLEAGITTGHDWPNTADELLRLQSAAELRRLHAEVEKLRQGKGETVAYIVHRKIDVGAGTDTNAELSWEPGLPDEASEPLYTTPPLLADACKVPLDLSAFDAAVYEELSKVSTVPYNSHEICKWFAKNVRAMLSAAPTQVETQGWRPIETAPKDGTMFLCWVSAVRYGVTDECQPYQQDASQVDFCSWCDGLDGNGYFDPACGQIGDSQDVTHWMPLPPAPSQGDKP